MQEVGARKIGVGCDGFVLIRQSKIANFTMDFFNPDGHPAEMCGNGARCAAHLAFSLGIGSENLTIETPAGILRALVKSNNVLVTMTPPTELNLDGSLLVDEQQFHYSSVNTGVPHVVVEAQDLEELNVQELGALFRNHPHFLPNGTNVNFVKVTGSNSLDARTYERGVEGETLACGTGLVACGIIACKRGLVKAPTSITCRGGYVMTFDCNFTHEGIDDVKLLGPVRYVYNGILEYTSHG